MKELYERIREEREIECPYCKTLQKIKSAINTATCSSCQESINLRDQVFDKGFAFQGEYLTRGKIVVERGVKIKANLNASQIIIKGKVLGKVKAVEKVELEESAELYGDLDSSKFIVKEGATFIGNCNVARKH